MGLASFKGEHRKNFKEIREHQTFPSSTEASEEVTVSPITYVLLKLRNKIVGKWDIVESKGAMNMMLLTDFRNKRLRTRSEFLRTYYIKKCSSCDRDRALR